MLHFQKRTESQKNIEIIIKLYLHEKISVKH